MTSIYNQLFLAWGHTPNPAIKLPTHTHMYAVPLSHIFSDACQHTVKPLWKWRFAYKAHGRRVLPRRYVRLSRRDSPVSEARRGTDSWTSQCFPADRVFHMYDLIHNSQQRCEVVCLLLPALQMRRWRLALGECRAQASKLTSSRSKVLI